MYNYWITGGGTQFVHDIFMEGGRSLDTIGVTIPYNQAMLDSKIIGKPEKYCSMEVANKMAIGAFIEGRRLGYKDTIGIGATFSLHKHNQRKGRFNGGYISIISSEKYYNLDIEFDDVDNPNYTRSIQEEQLSKAFKFCINDFHTSGRVFNFEKTDNVDVIFPGSFNPIHEGHLKIKQEAEKITGKKVYLEISLSNYEKPYKNFDCIDNNPEAIFTDAPKFTDKVKLFGNNKTFVIGEDTFLRIINDKNYKEDLRFFEQTGTNFLVFPRNGYFSITNRLEYELRMCTSLFNFISDFEPVNISSTDIRNKNDSKTS